MIADFCALIKRGLPPDTVCDYLLLHDRAFWLWTTKAKQHLNTPRHKIPRQYRICVDFYNAHRKARAEWEAERIDALHGRDARGKPKKTNWVREMTILERRDRKNFGRMDPQGGADEDFDPDESFL